MNWHQDRKRLLVNALLAVVGGTLLSWFLIPLYGASLGPTEEEIAQNVYTRCLEYASQGLLHLQTDGGRWWNDGDDFPTVCEVVARESPDPKLSAESERELYERLSPFDQWAKAKSLDAFYYYRAKAKPKKPAAAWILQLAAIITVFCFEHLGGQRGTRDTSNHRNGG